jgi:hypothetical protein
MIIGCPSLVLEFQFFWVWGERLSLILSTYDVRTEINLDFAGFGKLFCRIAFQR